MEQPLMSEPVEKRNKRLAAFLVAVFVVLWVLSTLGLMLSVQGRSI